MDGAILRVEARLHALTFHGGRLDDAARRYPKAPAPWLDLSTGINPLPWPAKDVAADLQALPSAAALRALICAAGDAFRAPALPLTALPGSEIGLRLLAHLDLPRPFHVVVPCYRSHFAGLPDAVPVAADQLEAAAHAGGTLLLANPNNPDGRLLAPERLLAIAHTLTTRGGLLVIDEAFADALDDASILPLLERDARVLVFRSFGKFYGLAGVRLGFAAGPDDLVGRLADMLGSWPVSNMAIGIGCAAYRDAEWQAATRIRLAGTADRLDQVLIGHGLSPQGVCPLFRLVQTHRVPVLFERLAHGGILTRPFDYAPDWLRIGLPADDVALARLDEALGDG